MAELQGARRDIVDSEWTTARVWDYGKLTHETGWFWYCCVPDDQSEDGFMLGDLSKHNITEHEDNTISVTPSILIGQHTSKKSYHGYLERGVWWEV